MNDHHDAPVENMLNITTITVYLLRRVRASALTPPKRLFGQPLAVFDNWDAADKFQAACCVRTIAVSHTDNGNFGDIKVT